MAVDIVLLNNNSLPNIDTNFQRVKEAFEDTVGRSGDLPNQMNSDFDMNNNDILNANVIEALDVLVDGNSVWDLSGKGWSPIFAAVDNAGDIVIQLVDYSSGNGEKPTDFINWYLGADGLVEDISEATIFAGGIISNGDKGDITVSGSGSIWVINNDSIVSTKIVDNAVTTNKINNNAVSEIKLSDDITLMLSKPVSDRSSMKAIDTSRYTIALMNNRMFYWDGSDLSVEVLSDPGEGIYVAPLDGTTGAWVAMDDTSKGYLADWWQIIGDGVTDDSVAFANALTTIDAMGGGDLILPRISSLGSTITIPPFVNLVSYSGGGVIFSGTGVNGLVVSEDTIFRGIKVDGNGTTRQIIAPLNTARRLKFIDCEIFGSASNGIFLQQGALNIKILDCYIHDIGLAGINISGLTVTGFVNDIVIKNCRIENTGRSGIVVGGVGETTTQTPLYATDVKIFGNRIINTGTVTNPKSSISIPYITGLIVEGNYCDTSGEHGIAGQENTKFLISNNICLNQPFGGISFQSGFDPFNASNEGIINNNILTDNDWGIMFRDKCTNLVVTGNYLRGNVSGSIRLFDSDGPSDSIVGSGNQLTPAGISNENASTNITIT